MPGRGSHAHLLRSRGGHGHARVTFVELFFDLVFVFAVTQLSHLLLNDLTLLGAIHTALLFLAVWWVWIYTTWVTNWLDPDRTPVRLCLLALMLAGLVLSTSIPQAFGARGLAFASAYAFMQVGRSLFVIWALGEESPGNTRNFQRITVWLAAAGAFWIAGAFPEAGARLVLWTVALGLEFVSPALGFWVPGLGCSTTEDWNVEGGHLAERCSLFVILSLGESLLVTGATFAGLEWAFPTVVAFGVAFVGSVVMWWIYFDTGAERGSDRIVSSTDPGRLARLAYTYIHLLIVAGVIVAAVGDELILTHPTGHSEPKVIAVMLGGPLLFLVGNLLFKGTMAGRLPLSHLVGLGLLLLLTPAAAVLSPLGLAATTTGIMTVVAIWETVSLRSARAPAIEA